MFDEISFWKIVEELNYSSDLDYDRCGKLLAKGDLLKKREYC